MSNLDWLGSYVVLLFTALDFIFTGDQIANIHLIIEEEKEF